jgi:hypothetical protein
MQYLFSLIYPYRVVILIASIFSISSYRTSVISTTPVSYTFSPMMRCAHKNYLIPGFVCVLKLSKNISSLLVLHLIYQAQIFSYLLKMHRVLACTLLPDVVQPGIICVPNKPIIFIIMGWGSVAFIFYFSFHCIQIF